MFVHVSVHSPKDAYREHLLDSMHRFKGALENVEGFIDGGVFEDEKTHLLALPDPMPSVDLLTPVAVDKTATVRFDTNR